MVKWWVAEEALGISLFCSLCAKDFTSAVLLAVNHGGDSDSTGAITGNLLGTLYGAEAIPSDLSTGVYNELGSMLEEGPSKLFDALASILGLEELVQAADALKNTRSRRSQAHKAVKDRLKTLRVELEAHADERAAKCLELLKGTKWKLDELQTIVAGGLGAGTQSDDSELAALRALAQLQGPDPEAATRTATELREALEEREAVAGTDAEKARRFAGILEKALEIHEAHGDGDFPVCGGSSALDDTWHQRAKDEVETLRQHAAGADRAIRRLAEAGRRARDLVEPTPAALGKRQLAHTEAPAIQVIR